MLRSLASPNKDLKRGGWLHDPANMNSCIANQQKLFKSCRFLPQATGYCLLPVACRLPSHHFKWMKGGGGGGQAQEYINGLSNTKEHKLAHDSWVITVHFNI
jgi:hypothetical protein